MITLGVVVNAPIGPLAHLGLARAYALSGDTAKAKTVREPTLSGINSPTMVEHHTSNSIVLGYFALNLR